MHERNLLLTVGIAALLSGGVFAAVWLHQRSSVLPAASAPQTITVLAAAHPLAAGALLRPEDISAIDVSPDEMRPGEILDDAADEAQYRGALVKRDFAAGEALDADGLLKSSDRTFLAAALTPGMRAITLPVEAPQTASGLVLPNDRVDVILTEDLAAHGAVAETVLTGLRVVAVESELTAAKPLLSAGPMIAAPEVHTPRTITLETSEADAQKLLVAARIGKLDLAVRSLVVAEAPEPAPTWASDVSKAMNTAPKDTPAQPTIEVMHGGKIEMR